MKLRNKKTGEIVEDAYVRETHDFQFDGQKHVLAVFRSNGHSVPERISGPYNSLAQLNDEWEDYEEPKEEWYIDEYGKVRKRVSKTLKDGFDNELLVAFETKEEAEKAVEKLKAWKRLKDKGARFKEWFWDKNYGTCIIIGDSEGSCIDDGDEQNKADLDLLFGEE